MSDYKDTLNLPKTGFPMKGNLPAKEPLIQKKWKDENLYKKLLNSNENSKKFILAICQTNASIYSTYERARKNSFTY